MLLPCLWMLSTFFKLQIKPHLSVRVAALPPSPSLKQEHLPHTRVTGSFTSAGPRFHLISSPGLGAPQKEQLSLLCSH